MTLDYKVQVWIWARTTDRLWRQPFTRVRTLRWPDRVRILVRNPSEFRVYEEINHS